MLRAKIRGLNDVILDKTLEFAKIILKISAKDIRVSGHPIKYFKELIILFITKSVNGI